MSNPLQKLPAARRPRKRATEKPPRANLGQAGQPLDHGHPFYFGFLAASGGVIAITLLRALSSASQVFVLIIISLFLASGLNPAVNFFQRRGLKRGAAVGLIVLITLAFVTLFSFAVIPPFVHQVNALLRSAPNLVADLKHNHMIASLNNHFGIIDSIQKKVASSIKDGQLAVGAFGGVIGVGKAVISGAISALTILVLTLYFTASLPSVTKAVYRLVPPSRRERVSRISDEIIARTGAFVGGQASVALIAGVFILIVSLVLQLPYPTALALLVFICGLIPLIGHLLGVSVVTLVAFTKSPLIALAAFLIYVAYVQIENYLVMPRIMKRSLEMPGIITIIAALLGTSLLGVVGGILSVPIAAAILLIIDEVVLKKTDAS